MDGAQRGGEQKQIFQWITYSVISCEISQKEKLGIFGNKLIYLKKYIYRSFIPKTNL